MEDDLNLYKMEEFLNIWEFVSLVYLICWKFVDHSKPSWFVDQLISWSLLEMLSWIGPPGRNIWTINLTNMPIFSFLYRENPLPQPLKSLFIMNTFDQTDNSVHHLITWTVDNYINWLLSGNHWNRFTSQITSVHLLNIWVLDLLISWF